MSPKPENQFDFEESQSSMFNPNSPSLHTVFMKAELDLSEPEKPLEKAPETIQEIKPSFTKAKIGLIAALSAMALQYCSVTFQTPKGPDIPTSNNTEAELDLNQSSN